MKKYVISTIAVLTLSVLTIAFIAGTVQGRPSFGTNCQGCHALRGDTSEGIARGAEERVSFTRQQTEVIAEIENQLAILKEVNKEILDLQAIDDLAKQEGASKTAGLIEALIIERQQTFRDNLNKIGTIPTENQGASVGRRQGSRSGTGLNIGVNGSRGSQPREREGVRGNQPREGQGVSGEQPREGEGVRGGFGGLRGSFGGPRGSSGGRGDFSGTRSNVNGEREDDED